MTKSKNGLFWLSVYYTYLLLVWGVFRLLFKFPTLIDELWFKPVLWLLPLYWVWYKGGRKIKFFAGSGGKALLWGVGVGSLYVAIVVLINLKRFGMETIGGVALNMGEIMGVGLITAICEELVFSGYIFQSILQKVKKIEKAMMITAVMFAAIHIPIGLFVYGYGAGQMVGFLAVVGLLSAANAYLMGRTRNVLAPILSHFMWLTVVSLLAR